MVVPALLRWGESGSLSEVWVVQRTAVYVQSEAFVPAGQLAQIARFMTNRRIHLVVTDIASLGLFWVGLCHSCIPPVSSASGYGALLASKAAPVPNPIGSPAGIMPPTSAIPGGIPPISGSIGGGGALISKASGS
jgi:hypothetical protein